MLGRIPLPPNAVPIAWWIFTPMGSAAPGVCQVREVELRGQIFSGKRCPMQVGKSGNFNGKNPGKNDD